MFLVKLNLNNVGCFLEKEIIFNDKLNLIIGNNLKGKSLILDALFFSLTGIFPKNYNDNINAGFKIIPLNNKNNSSIILSLDGNKDNEFEYLYSKPLSVWKQIKDNTPDDGIIIYAMQDGSFVLWDSLINSNKRNKNREHVEPLILTEKNIFNGIERKFLGLNTKINYWKINSDNSYIEEFENILNIIFIKSKIKIGESKRLDVSTCIDYPTIVINDFTHLIHRLSFEIKRIIELMFLIYLSKEERIQYQKILGLENDKIPVYNILIDDVELGLSQETINEFFIGFKKFLDCNNINTFLTTRADNTLIDDKSKIFIN